jgi:hypothetical protein
MGEDNPHCCPICEAQDSTNCGCDPDEVMAVLIEQELRERVKILTEGINNIIEYISTHGTCPESARKAYEIAVKCLGRVNFL